MRAASICERQIAQINRSHSNCIAVTSGAQMPCQEPFLQKQKQKKEKKRVKKKKVWTELVQAAQSDSKQRQIKKKTQEKTLTKCFIQFLSPKLAPPCCRPPVVSCQLLSTRMSPFSEFYCISFISDQRIHIKMKRQFQRQNEREKHNKDTQNINTKKEKKTITMFND